MKLSYMHNALHKLYKYFVIKGMIYIILLLTGWQAYIYIYDESLRNEKKKQVETNSTETNSTETAYVLSTNNTETSKRNSINFAT